MKIYTIGFTRKTAREFFELLRSTDARYLVDIRISNNSQLAGFTKQGNIEYFTEQLTSMTYVRELLLAPSPELFKRYRKDWDWEAYEPDYKRLLAERELATSLGRGPFEGGAVLLCTEVTPERCHRRLASEYLRKELFPGAEVVHL